MIKLLLTVALAAAAAHAADLRLYVFDCGKLHYADPTRFGFKNEEVKVYDLSVGCYLIVHPKGTLMWDVGVIPDSDFPKDGKPATKLYATATKTLKSQVLSTGHNPDDITYLAMSHSHWDHLANANEFAHSIWLVRPVERNILFGPNPPERSTPDEYNLLKDSKTVSLPEGDYDVFGDGTVVIKPAYGHTPGHSVLFVKLSQDRPDSPQRRPLPLPRRSNRRPLSQQRVQQGPNPPIAHSDPSIPKTIRREAVDPARLRRVPETQKGPGVLRIALCGHHGYSPLPLALPQWLKTSTAPI